MIHPLRYGLGNLPAAEAQQDVAKASDAKAEATGTATDELSEDGLEAVAGGKGNGRSNRYCGG